MNNHQLKLLNPQSSGLQDRMAEMWDMSGPVPLPKFDPECPICHSTQILLKEALFHTRAKVSSHKFRCDIKFKCTTCSFVWKHGLVVPDEMAKQHTMNRMIHFREIQKLFKNQEKK